MINRFALAVALASLTASASAAELPKNSRQAAPASPMAELVNGKTGLSLPQCIQVATPPPGQSWQPSSFCIWFMGRRG